MMTSLTQKNKNNIQHTFFLGEEFYNCRGGCYTIREITKEKILLQNEKANIQVPYTPVDLLDAIVKEVFKTEFDEVWAENRLFDLWLKEKREQQEKEIARREKEAKEIAHNEKKTCYKEPIYVNRVHIIYTPMHG